MKSDKIKSEIEKVTDPQVKKVLKTMRSEYEDLTNLESLGGHISIAIILFRLAFLLGFIFLVGVLFIQGYAASKEWFTGLSGGFTKSGVIALVVAAMLGLIGLPAAYGYGKRKNKG